MCTYQKTNGEPPWCTHDCNGCVWWRDDEIKETFMNVIMSEEQSNFIEGIKKYMLEASNMTESEAYNFAFVVWQHQEWLREFLTWRKA